MNDTASLSLATQLRLQDIRLRVMNRTSVSKDEYRTLLLDLRKDRESASRASAAARKIAKAAEKKTAQPLQFDLNSMFGSSTTSPKADLATMFGAAKAADEETPSYEAEP